MALLIAISQRRLGWKRFMEVMKETAMTSVMLYVVLFGAMMFSQLISFSGLADQLLSLVNESGLSRMGILLAILLVFLLLGCVMDAMAIILIFVPLFAAHTGGPGLRSGVVRHHRGGADRDRPDHPTRGHERFRAQGQPAPGACGHHLPRIGTVRGVDILRLALLVAFPSISLWLVQLMR
jgi:TRAP-type C4-dicarboxylate transport system permease large subunit